MEKATPDDIKIIAQFLAGRDGAPSDWQSFTREAFKLRKQLKSRAGAVPGFEARGGS